MHKLRPDKQTLYVRMGAKSTGPAQRETRNQQCLNRTGAQENGDRGLGTGRPVRGLPVAYSLEHAAPATAAVNDAGDVSVSGTLFILTSRPANTYEQLLLSEPEPG